MSNARPNKAQKKKKTVQTVFTVIAIIVLVLTAVVLFFRQRVKTQFANRSTTTVETAKVTTGSLRTTVSGSGALASEDIQDVNVPSVVEVDTVYVEAGDDVTEGMLLASVKPGTVLAALADTQSQLDSLDKDLKAAADDKVDSRITAGVTGRVKAVFAAKDDDVADVMYENGALALLSMDGYMAVEFEAEGYQVADEVTVVTSDGKEYPGTVSTVRRGTVTVLITDDGPLYQDTVTVDGKYTGKLDIHEPLKITGYAGTVSLVSARENAKVYSSTQLFTLTDTDWSANYDSLLSKRAEYEELYLTLVKLYKDGGILSPIDGTVEAVPDDETDSTAALTASYSMAAAAGASSGTADLLDETLVLTLDPNKAMTVTIDVDETDILSLSVGQEAVLTVESIGEDTYPGIVTAIDTNAASASGVTMYAATITLDKAPKMLTGMTASVDITIEGVENALIIPFDAVHRTSASAYVYTSYDEENDVLGDMVEITTGLTNGKNIEVVSGLKEGDTIYYISKVQTFTFGNMTFTRNTGISGNRSSGSSGRTGSSGMPSGMPGGMPGMSGMPRS